MTERKGHSAETTRKWSRNLIFDPPPSPQHSFYEYIPPPPSSLPPTEGALCLIRVHLLSEWDGPAYIDPDLISRVSVEFWENKTTGPAIIDASKGIQTDKVLLTFLPPRAGDYRITLDGTPINRTSEETADDKDTSVLNICALSPFKCKYERVSPDESLLTPCDKELKEILPTSGRLCNILVHCRNDENKPCQAPIDIKSQLHIMNDVDGGLSLVNYVEVNYNMEYIWIKFIPQMKGKYKIYINDAIIGCSGSNSDDSEDGIEVSEFSSKYSFFEYIPSAEGVPDVMKGYPLDPMEDATCQVHIFTVDKNGKHVCLPLDMSSRIKIVYICRDGQMLPQDIEISAMYSYAVIYFTPHTAGTYKVQLDGEFISGRCIESDDVDNIKVRQLVSPVHSYFIYVTPQTPAQDSIEKNMSNVEPLVDLICYLHIEAKDDNGQSTALPKNFQRRVKVYRVEEDNSVSPIDVFHVACLDTTAALHFTPHVAGFYKIFLDDVPIQRHFQDGSTTELLEVVSLSPGYSYFENLGQCFEDMDCKLRVFARSTNDKPVCLPTDLSSRISISQDNLDKCCFGKPILKCFNTYVEISFKPCKWGSFHILLDGVMLSTLDTERNSTINVLTLFSPRHSIFEFIPRRVTVTDREGEDVYSEPLQGTRCCIRIHARDDQGQIPDHLPEDARNRVRVFHKPTSQEMYSQTIKVQECDNKSIDITMTPETGGVYSITVDGEALMTKDRSSILEVYGMIPFDESLCTCHRQQGQLEYKNVCSFTFKYKQNEKFPFSIKTLIGHKNIYFGNLKRVTNVDIYSKDIIELTDGFSVNFEAGDQLTADRVCEMITYVLKAKHHRNVASYHRKKKSHFELLAQDAMEFEHFSEASYLKKLKHAHDFIVNASEEIACDSVFAFFNHSREVDTIDLCDIKSSAELIKRLEQRLEVLASSEECNWLEVIFSGEQSSEQTKKNKNAIEKYLTERGRDVHLISKTSFVVELRPYRGLQPCHGQFYCFKCENAWSSKYSWVGYRQTCYICRARKCLPHKLMAADVKINSDPEPEHDAELCEKCQQVAGDCRHVNEELWNHKEYQIKTE